MKFLQSAYIFIIIFSSVSWTAQFYTYFFTVTPPDYQPPGFKDGDCEGVIFEGEPMYLNVGEVPTPFHTFKVKVTTEKERMENIDSAILLPKPLKTPLQKILMDKDDVEDEQEHYISVSIFKEIQSTIIINVWLSSKDFKALIYINTVL